MNQIFKRLYTYVVMCLFGFKLLVPINFVMRRAVYRSRQAGESVSQLRKRLGELHVPAALSVWHMCERYLRMQITIDSDVEVVPGRRYIVVANHRTALDHPVVNLAATKAGITDLRWVLRASMRKVPVIGWVNALMDSAFLERRKHADSRRMLRDLYELSRTAASAQDDDASVIIYPEGTRMRGTPEHDAAYRHVLTPKHAGYQQLARKLPDRHLLLVTIDWGSLNDGVTFTDLAGFLDRHIRVRIRDKGLVDPHNAQAQLYACWDEHEQFLADSKTVTDSGDALCRLTA